MYFSRKPPRLRVDDAAYFLTFNTFRRLPVLLDPIIASIIIHDLGISAQKLRSLLAFTIQKDHIHLLVEVDKAVQISEFLRDFKKHSSRLIGLYRGGRDLHVWQRGTMDHWIRPSEDNVDFERHMLYLYSNCWRHQHILPRDYPYHNFWEAVRRGWVTPDLCDDSP